MNNSTRFSLNELTVARFESPNLVASLVEVVNLACSGDCGGACATRKLLLGLYDPRQHFFELTELQRLDADMFEHAINCIRLRVTHRMEPHEFFVDGSSIFETLRETENAWRE